MARQRFCGTSHRLTMLARLKFLPVRPAGLECFAQAPRKFAGRPEEDGRVLGSAERRSVEGRGVLQRGVLRAVAALDAPLSRVTLTLAPGASHIVIYHLVVDGSARARLEGGPDVGLSPGDIVVFPHGDAHHLSGGTGGNQVESAAILGRSRPATFRRCTPVAVGRRRGSCAAT